MGKLTSYHYHEALDRAHVANDHFNEYVETHPAVMYNPELKKKAEEVTALMYAFYNLCSSYCMRDDRAQSFEELGD